MAEIVQLAEYKSKGLLRSGFALWRKRFEDRFDAHTRLKDLNAVTLSQLAEPGDDSAALIYGLIIGFMGYGEVSFDSLDATRQSLIIDRHFFLADHIRFEMMTRLGWLSRSTASQFSLFEMVRQWTQVKGAFQHNQPLLAADHPDYSTYQSLIERDQQVFIRRMLPDALDAFKKANNL